MIFSKFISQFQNSDIKLLYEVFVVVDVVVYVDIEGIMLVVVVEVVFIDAVGCCVFIIVDIIDEVVDDVVEVE